jgi:hypothetical protein
MSRNQESGISNNEHHNLKMPFSPKSKSGKALRPHRVISGAILVLLLAACTSSLSTELPTSTAPIELPTVTSTAVPTIIPTETAEPVLIPTPDLNAYDPKIADSWKNLPIVPETVSDRVRALYAAGKTSGLNQNAFSKAGDCETSTNFFLAPFDWKQSGYRLGEFEYLRPTLDFYHGSFSRVSVAAKSGFSVFSVFSTIWADPKVCLANEIPLGCEIRINKPAILLITFGTNDANVSSRAAFEKNLRKVLDYAISNNVIPVLTTKADNLEGDESVNAVIARLAYEYEIPLWNFWRAAQALPNSGLEADMFHLTYAQPFFDSPENMQKGMPVRNLTALQILDKLRTELEK